MPKCKKCGKFQSTLPVWGETPAPCARLESQGISIHSPRVGRDFKIIDQPQYFYNFNPLSPCGERLDELIREMEERGISIHSPRVGRDSKFEQHARAKFVDSA